MLCSILFLLPGFQCIDGSLTVVPATGTFISIDKFTKFCSRLRTEHYMHMINVMVLLYHRPYYRTSVLFVFYAIHLQPVEENSLLYYVKITLISSFVNMSVRVIFACYSCVSIFHCKLKHYIFLILPDGLECLWRKY